MFVIRRQALLGGWLFAASLAHGAAPSAPLPSFEQVKSVVADSCREIKDFAPNDILSRKQAQTILNRIEQLGWTPADRPKLEKQVLDEGSFLIGQFRTPTGKKFMRQISDMPLGYDRLDRLSQLPQGRSTVERLVRGPDGYKMLEYMTKSPGGKDLTKMLSKDGSGNFDKPTGKIYTAEQFVERLQVLYGEAISGPSRKR